MSLYLVTGGAGFIGSNLVGALTRLGERVRVLDDFSTGRRENLEGLSGFELIEGTITDPEMCRSACEGADYVLHQAALPSVPRSVKDPVQSDFVNTFGTLNMLVAARNTGVKRFVLAASSSAYGNTPTLPKHEEMPTCPLSPYAVSKVAAENYCQVFFKCYSLETVCLRYFNIYGPNQDPNSQYGAVIPVFCKHLLGGTRPPVHGDGMQTRDFTYIDDAVEANLNACHAPPVCAGQVLNIGAGGRTSVIAIFEKLRELLGRPDIEPDFTAPREGDVRDSFASIEKAGRFIGYEPKFNIDEGLARAINYYRAVCSKKPVSA